MKLSIEEIKDLVIGAVEVEVKDGMFRFYRFTADQAEKYLTEMNREDFYDKTFATAGVRLECTTDAAAFCFRFAATPASSRRFSRFDVYVDDVLCAFQRGEELTGAWCGEFRMELPEGAHKLTLYFSNLYGMAIGDVELTDATFAEPCAHQYTAISFGDSITQGYDAVCPSVSYVNRMATVLDAAVINKGIGGDRFNPALLTVDDGIIPDFVTVAYGTNDWNGATREEFETNLAGFMKGLAARYPDAKVFVITPIWRQNHLSTEKKVGTFAEVAACIKAEAEKYGFTVIDGMKLVPHDPAFFAADVLHPNDLGHLWYGETLAKEIKKHLL